MNPPAVELLGTISNSDRERTFCYRYRFFASSIKGKITWQFHVAYSWKKKRKEKEKCESVQIKVFCPLIARWHHFTTITKIPQYVIFLCKFEILFFQKERTTWIQPTRRRHPMSIRASHECTRWGIWKEFCVTSCWTQVPWMWQKADKKIKTESTRTLSNLIFSGQKFCTTENNLKDIAFFLSSF